MFLVRKGNPKGIKDWDDLVKPACTVVVPNPKTSGGARWAYLAAYAYALETYNHDDAKAKDFITQALQKCARARFRRARLDHHVCASAASATCCSRGKTRRTSRSRNSARTNLKSSRRPLSILAEPPVAVVDKNAKRHGTTEVATAYLKYLYSDEGQEIAAKNFYRPRNEAIAAKICGQFHAVETRHH